MPVHLRGWKTGAAWLSSDRAVRCTLNWGNDRNPCPMLHCHRGLPSPLGVALKRVNEQRAGRKAGTTSNQHGLYALGYTRATMAGTMGCKAVRRSQPLKPVVVRIEGCNSPS